MQPVRNCGKMEKKEQAKHYALLTFTLRESSLPERNTKSTVTPGLTGNRLAMLKHCCGIWSTVHGPLTPEDEGARLLLYLP
jgi:hypothetical protein